MVMGEVAMATAATGVAAMETVVVARTGPPGPTTQGRGRRCGKEEENWSDNQIGRLP